MSGLSHKTLGFTSVFFSQGLTQPTFLDSEQIEQSCPGSFRDKAWPKQEQTPPPNPPPPPPPPIPSPISYADSLSTWSVFIRESSIFLAKISYLPLDWFGYKPSKWSQVWPYIILSSKGENPFGLCGFHCYFLRLSGFYTSGSSSKLEQGVIITFQNNYFGHNCE